MNIESVREYCLSLPLVTEAFPFPDFDYASPILDFSIFRGQNRHFCPRLVSFEHQTKA